MTRDVRSDTLTTADGEPPVFAFNRVEFAGSLGDLGTLLPLAIGMIVVIGLDVTSVMAVSSVGLRTLTSSGSTIQISLIW